jgi:hypothetical protein
MFFVAVGRAALETTRGPFAHVAAVPARATAPTVASNVALMYPYFSTRPPRKNRYKSKV